MSNTTGYDPSRFRALTFHDAVPAFHDGTDTPRAYLERCLETIAEREPVVRGWVTMAETEARSVADAAGARYRAGRPLSTIDGMPVGIKDMLMTRDMPTELGSPLYKGNQTRQDSACVMALRQAGAIVLGKTVTTELGMSHPGPTTNPFDPACTPGGSSSGSAAVVGARMVPAAIGTQVVGSVIRPAAYCANHAIKPTFGAMNRGERLGFSQSHLGVHAGSLQDMWAVAMEITLRSGGDPGHPGLYGDLPIHAAVQPTRLAVMESEGWAMLDDATLEAFERMLASLERSGVTILRRKDSPLIEAFERAIDDALAICRDLCGWEQRWTLQNLIERFQGGLSDSMMSRLGLADAMTLDDYRTLLVRREQSRMAFQALGGIVDGIISVSCVGPAPRSDNTLKDGGISHTTGLPAFNAASSMLGCPTITVPMMAVGGMPVGVQLSTQWHRDAELTGMARWLGEAIAPVSVA